MTSNHTRPAIFGAAAILAASIVAALQSCNLEDFVQVDVPGGVRQSLDVPEDDRVSLAEAEYLWEDWSDYVERESIRFSREIKESRERYELLASLANMGIGALEQQVAGVPFGPFLLAGLGGLGGLFLKRPGDRAREAALRAQIGGDA